jgi:hypothetical protein
VSCSTATLRAWRRSPSSSSARPVRAP